MLRAGLLYQLKRWIGGFFFFSLLHPCCVASEFLYPTPIVTNFWLSASGMTEYKVLCLAEACGDMCMTISSVLASSITTMPHVVPAIRYDWWNVRSASWYDCLLLLLTIFKVSFRSSCLHTDWDSTSHSNMEDPGNKKTQTSKSTYSIFCTKFMIWIEYEIQYKDIYQRHSTWLFHMFWWIRVY